MSLLNTETLQLVEEAQTKLAELTPQITQIQAQLDVLGPPAPNETAEVTQQRKTLNRAKTLLDKQIDQADAVKTNATNLSTQINNLRRSALKSQIALNSGSVLGQNFGYRLSRHKIMTSPNSVISNNKSSMPGMTRGHPTGIQAPPFICCSR